MCVDRNVLTFVNFRLTNSMCPVKRSLAHGKVIDCALEYETFLSVLVLY